MILVLGCTAEISRSKRYSNETLGCASIEYKGGWLLPRCIVPHTGNAFDANSILTCVYRCVYIYIYIYEKKRNKHVVLICILGK